MTKAETIAEAMDGKGCLGRSQDDEPVFVLVARDQTASTAVRVWAFEAKKQGVPDEKVDDAYKVADAMDRWREAHGGGKVPD